MIIRHTETVSGLNQGYPTKLVEVAPSHDAIVPTLLLNQKPFDSDIPLCNNTTDDYSSRVSEGLLNIDHTPRKEHHD